MTIKKLSQYPFHLFELVTSAKSFKDNPIIGSPMLNRLGLHIIRLLLSHGIMRLRMLMSAGFISDEDRKHFFKYGYILKENFLNHEDFAAVKNELKQFNGEIREARQGNTITQRAALSPKVLQDYPAIQNVFLNKQLKHLTSFSAGHLRAPLYYLEEVKNQYIDGVEDPQKHFHHDTFHPSMKCWLFVDDVAEKAGAFTFIPRSQKLDWARIKWEYKMSLNAHTAKNNYHAKGSTRYSEEDLLALGLPEPKEFSVKKNTLLLVNVFGIHRRGDSESKSTRLALWGDSRTNPFIPFPGIGGEFVNYWQYYFLNLYRKKADNLAKQRGYRPPWVVVSRDKSNN